MPVDTQANRQSILQALKSAESFVPATQTGAAPQQGRLSDAGTAELTAHFARVLSAHNTHVATVDSIDDLPHAIADYLSTLAAPPLIHGGSNPRFSVLPWSASGLRWTEAELIDDGQVALAGAECGIADTGTAVLLSGKLDPTRNNFLAEHHVVVLSPETIVPYSEDAWHYLLKRHERLPRAVNFISGPSSSADVGLKLEYGAHGPRTLAVFLIAE